MGVLDSWQKGSKRCGKCDKPADFQFDSGELRCLACVSASIREEPRDIDAVRLRGQWHSFESKQADGEKRSSNASSSRARKR